MRFSYFLFFTLNEITKKYAVVASSNQKRNLIPCPNAFFTEKLNPFDEEIAKKFNKRCEQGCSQSKTYHGIWYINKNGEKEAACWSSSRYAVKFNYDARTLTCECGIHINARSPPIRPCKPRMVIRGVPTIELCDEQCRNKRVHSYNSVSRVYQLGFCYVKDGYNYPNLLGKPTYANHPINRELKCTCAVEDLPGNSLNAIETRRVYFRRSDEHYSPNELLAIINGLNSGTSVFLSMSESSVQVNPRKLKKTSTENVSESSRNHTEGTILPDYLLGAFSQASLSGAQPQTHAKSLHTGSSKQKKCIHPSSSTKQVNPATASTENVTRENPTRLLPAHSSTSTTAIQTSIKTNANPSFLVKPIPRRLVRDDSPTLGTTFLNTLARTRLDDSINTSPHGFSGIPSGNLVGQSLNSLSKSSRSCFVKPNPRGSSNVHSVSSGRSYSNTAKGSTSNYLGNFNHGSPNVVSSSSERSIQNTQATQEQVHSERGGLDTTLSLGGIFARNTDSSPNPASKKKPRGG